MRHCPYPSGLFNRIPQSGGFGLTSAGAYIFSGNVVLETLRVVSKGLRFLKPSALTVGLLTAPRVVFFTLPGITRLVQEIRCTPSVNPDQLFTVVQLAKEIGERHVAMPVCEIVEIVEVEAVCIDDRFGSFFKPIWVQTFDRIEPLSLVQVLENITAFDSNALNCPITTTHIFSPFSGGRPSPVCYIKKETHLAHSFARLMDFLKLQMVMSDSRIAMQPCCLDAVSDLAALSLACHVISISSSCDCTQGNGCNNFMLLL